MNYPEYQIFKVNLTAAGSMHIDGQYNLIRMVWAGTQDTDGRPASMSLSAMVELSFGNREDDFLPIGINGAAMGEVTRYQLRWTAQPGIWAYFLLTRDDGRVHGIKVEAPPARQIVTQNMGTGLIVAAVAVGTSAVQLVAANGARQKLSVRNNSSGTVYLGVDAAVTTAAGWPMGPGEGFTFEGTTSAIWAIGSAAGLDVRTMEEA